MSDPSQSSDDSSDGDDFEFYEEWNDLTFLKEIVKNLEHEKITLKILQQEFLGEWRKRENQLKDEFVDKEIFIENISSPIKNLLGFLQLEPPNENRKTWIIPATWDIEPVFQKYFFIKDTVDDSLNFEDFKFGNSFGNSSVLFHLPKIQKLTNVSRCKVCKIECKSLKQHLNKAKDCRSHYSESDMNDANEKLKEIAKANKKKLNAADYQRNKSDLAQRYKDNKDEYNKKSAKYYEENKMKFKKRTQSSYEKRNEKRTKANAKYYLKNKDHLLAKARDRKKTEEERYERESIRDRINVGRKKIMDCEKKARVFNSQMKLQFELTRGQGIKSLQKLDVSSEIKDKLDLYQKKIDQLYGRFEKEIDDAVKEMNSKFELDIEEAGKKDTVHKIIIQKIIEAEKSTSTRFDELGTIPVSSNTIYHNYENFFEMVDNELEMISNRLKISLSYSKRCDSVVVKSWN